MILSFIVFIFLIYVEESIFSDQLQIIETLVNRSALPIYKIVLLLTLLLSGIAY
jgi:hypothetical protein